MGFISFIKNIGKGKTINYNPQFVEKKPFFSDKEIIFRSQNRAKVLTISSRAQMIFVCLVLVIGFWSVYSYHIYNRSGKIISVKERELDATRDAYVDLVSDFMSLHKNIVGVISTAGGKEGSHKLEQYKKQASAVEDKIKQMSAERNWASQDKIEEKITIREALLQRDIATSERDELRRQMHAMEDIVSSIKDAEMEVLEQVEKISAREVKKIKSALNEINVPLKKRGLYFNALANSKKNNKGGLFVPEPKTKLEDKAMNDKVSGILKNVADWEYYKEVVQYVPLGKPVWSYWATSAYGRRDDPFNGKKAYHKGVDLASRTGNKIRVQAKGKVTRAEYAGGYGNLVVVDHGNGFVTKYGHLHKIYVKKGDYVEYNDTLGEVGSTGRSTGPHLHYEIIYQGVEVNPMPFVKAKI